MNDATAVGAIFIAIMVLLGFLVVSWAVPIRLWIEAMASGVHVGLGSLVGMRLRKVSPPAIVRPLIAATKAGLVLDVNEFEAHYLAGGDVARVANALISADKANIDLTIRTGATAIDLAGRDVFEAVQVSVNPKVIETPPSFGYRQGRHPVDRAIARVTVRANIDRLVGGAGEETIHRPCRRGHRFSTIGSSTSHARLCSKTRTTISKTVLAKGLDSGHGFRDLVHRHCRRGCRRRISAPKLQTDQAEADLQVAQCQGGGAPGTRRGHRAGIQGPGGRNAGPGHQGRGGSAARARRGIPEWPARSDGLHAVSECRGRHPDAGLDRRARRPARRGLGRGRIRSDSRDRRVLGIPERRRGGEKEAGPQAAGRPGQQRRPRRGAGPRARCLEAVGGPAAGSEGRRWRSGSDEPGTGADSAPGRTSDRCRSSGSETHATARGSAGSETVRVGGITGGGADAA